MYIYLVGLRVVEQRVCDALLREEGRRLLGGEDGVAERLQLAHGGHRLQRGSWGERSVINK